jgi:hypothetical protein
MAPAPIQLPDGGLNGRPRSFQVDGTQIELLETIMNQVETELQNDDLEEGELPEVETVLEPEEQAVVPSGGASAPQVFEGPIIEEVSPEEQERLRLERQARNIRERMVGDDGGRREITRRLDTRMGMMSEDLERLPPDLTWQGFQASLRGAGFGSIEMSQLWRQYKQMNNR